MIINYYNQDEVEEEEVEEQLEARRNRDRIQISSGEPVNHLNKL